MKDDDSLENSLKIIKKLKKKLHQIAHLETLDRKLTVEELIKVSSKDDIRQKLNELSPVVNAEDESRVSSIEAQNDPNHNECTDGNATIEEDESPPPAKKQLTDIEASAASGDGPTVSDITLDANKKDTDQISVLKLRKAWKKKTFEVAELTGHNGLVCSLDIAGNWLTTGSQDTSVKLWDLTTTQELRNLPGHSGTVTCLKIMDKYDSNKLYKSMSLDSNEVCHLSLKSLKSERILITGSLDCSIKIWLIPQGIQLKSIYNYSPVSTLLLIRSVVFVGTDSGKLTSFNLTTGQQICNLNIHDDKISLLKWDGELMLSASYDGDLKLWEIEDNEKFAAFDETLDDIAPKLKHSLKNNFNYETERPILCACFYQENIVFGDDGYNLKVLNISEGEVGKYPNHVQGSGFTDSLLVFNDLLLSASYNPIDGAGSFNVRVLEDDSSLSYVASLCHSELPRLFCCCVDKALQYHYLVTGGEKLLVWKRKTASKDVKDTLEGQKLLLKAKYLLQLDKSDVSSSVESEDTETEDESSSWWWGNKTSQKTLKRRNSLSESSTDSGASKNSKTKASSWWCSLV